MLGRRQEAGVLGREWGPGMAKVHLLQRRSKDRRPEERVRDGMRGSEGEVTGPQKGLEEQV